MTSVPSPAPVPVTLLTGFLGSGKTTLLNRGLQEAAMADTLVIINEFGQTALDHMLVAHSQENIIQEMGNGCLCCTIRRDLVQTLRDIGWRFSRQGRRQFNRVLIETTGLADPVPIIHTLLSEPQLAGKYSLDGLVTVVDLEHGLSTLDRYAEARRQVAVADLLLLSKRDCVDADQVLAVHVRLDELHPWGQRHVLAQGETVAPWLLGLGGQQGQWRAWGAQAFQREHHGGDHDHDHDHDDVDVSRHGSDIRAISAVLPTELPPERLDECLSGLCAWAGERLLRLKGVLAVQDRLLPQVVHAVQHRIYPMQELPQWPWPRREGRLVLITRELDPAQTHARLRELDAMVRFV